MPAGTGESAFVEASETLGSRDHRTNPHALPSSTPATVLAGEITAPVLGVGFLPWWAANPIRQKATQRKVRRRTWVRCRLA